MLTDVTLFFLFCILVSEETFLEPHLNLQPRRVAGDSFTTRPRAW